LRPWRLPGLSRTAAIASVASIPPPTSLRPPASDRSRSPVSCAMQNWRRTAALREPAGAHEIHACDVPPLSQKMTGGRPETISGPRHRSERAGSAFARPENALPTIIGNADGARPSRVHGGPCRPLLRLQGEPAPRHRQAAQARADERFIRLLRAIPSIPAIAEAVDAVGAGVPTGRAVVDCGRQWPKGPRCPPGPQPCATWMITAPLDASIAASGMACAPVVRSARPAAKTIETNLFMRVTCGFRNRHRCRQQLPNRASMNVCPIVAA
jgi:hypothetical protein